ncbi:MAG: TolC family protein, partial [Rhizobiales bacterium]|nr:TolC family protein [Rhizobacter sp.]
MKKLITPRWVFAPLFAALVLAGCSTVTAFEPVAAPAAPLAFKELDGRWAALQPAEAQPRGEWWKAFADPLLDDLVARADRNNTSIQLTAARLAQARALLRATDADRLPQLGFSAGANRQSASPALGTTAPSTVLNAGLGASYEPDLFGRLAKASNAAALDAQSREALVQSTRLLVQSDVAQTYFGLRALDAERALVRQTVGAYRDTLRLTERRYAAGDVAELDLARVRTEVASTESQALALDRRRAELEHALAVLLGEMPSALTVEERASEADWTGPLPQVPPGVPST